MQRTLWMTPMFAVALAIGGCNDDAPTTTADASTSNADAAVVVHDDAAEAVNDDAATNDDAAADDASESPDAGGGVCAATAVPCQDESFQELLLFDAVNPAAVTTTATTGGLLSQVDARGGVSGGNITPRLSYVYLRFTETGLERVELSDDTAFSSQGWDIAMRRFVIRLNSGVSGPSCVVARRAPPNLSFDEVDTVPTTPARVEEYMTPAPACALVSDGSGLDSSPGTALQSYWEYPGCVKMTGNVFVITLADGRSVKLQVLSYYSIANQQLCDTQGRVGMPSGSGALRVKWAFLP